MFSTETYQRRRDKLANSNSEGIFLFLGNIENPINFEHNAYPFRQDSTFLYFFGISQPAIAAIIDLDEQKTIVFGDEATLDEIVWTGKLETLKSKSQKSGVSHTLPYSQLGQYLNNAKNKGRKVHFLPPYQSANKLLLSDLLGQPVKQLQASPTFIKAVVALRAIKEDQEVQQIEEAVRVSTEMHLLAMRLTRAGIKEGNIASEIACFAANHNCRLAYPPIVTKHGEILHNSHQLNTIENGDMLLNDSGVETQMGYAADLTRTIPVGKRFSSKQKEIYNIVLDALSAARDALKPGIKYKEVHLLACQRLVKGLVSLGIMKGDPDKAVAQNAHSLFFQCGLGHLMGLDVHDMEDLGEQYVGYTPGEPKDTHTFGLKSLRLGRTLESGFVVTVEPGIYFIPTLIDQWQSENKLSEFINYNKLAQYRDFGGIRIEDDFLITQDGYRLLGPELIKTVDEIENYRSHNA
ncbi:MAG: aminopeptidase P family protein [Sphingobacterium sp.]|uniref:aminopeptidase P family protein n=1 Tax=Sphingobacterium sp. JB170 TaxID=1434842 RepID=UPI00097E811C|nr:aminopeptidase P family protein [Sphingobacterium sp. JB170]SJN48963.1 Xaa-Pro aminopeptidase [Sphingobacterium sp. JB170]